MKSAMRFEVEAVCMLSLSIHELKD